MIDRCKARLALLRVRYFAELWFGNEAVAIGHLDLRQAVVVELRIRRRDSVQTQDVGDSRIGVVDAERTGVLVGHGAMNVVEQGRRIGPEAAYGLDGRVRRKSALPAGQAVLDSALAVWSVTPLAILLIHRIAVRGCAATF